MTSLLKEIEWYRGDSYPITLFIRNKKTKLPVDITGCTFLLTVNAEQDPVDDSNQVFQVAGVLDADPTTGKVSFTPSEANADFVKGNYWFDLQMIDAAGSKRTISKHPWTQIQDITKV